MKKIIVLKEGSDDLAFALWLISKGVKFNRILGLPRFFTTDVEVDHPDIETMEDDIEIRPTFEQEVSLANDYLGWNLPRICRRRTPWVMNEPGPDTTYESLLNGENTVLYIVDSGTDPNVTELLGSRISQTYWTGGPGDQDMAGHGTSCAVLAIGRTMGVARAAMHRSYRIFEANNTGTTVNILAGIGAARAHYLADNRPGVLSCSFGGIGTASAVATAINDCLNVGLMMFVSAGNDATDIATINSTWIPAGSQHCVVGATMMNDTPVNPGTWGTNWGDRVDICAPGLRTKSILCTEAGGGNDVIRSFNGTSAACPIVAGIALAILGSLGAAGRLTTRAQALALKNFIISLATDAISPHPSIPNITSKLAYLPPRQRTFLIPGINA